MEPDRIYKDILSVLIRKRSADSNPRTGPNRSGPDTGYRYPTLWNSIGSYRGPGHNRMVRRRSVHVRNIQPDIPGNGPMLTEAGIQPVKLTPNRFAFGLPTLVHLSSDRQLPGLWTQSGFDRFKDGLPNMTGPVFQYKLPGRSEGYNPTPAPKAELMDNALNVALLVPEARRATRTGLVGALTDSGLSKSV